MHPITAVLRPDLRLIGMVVACATLVACGGTATTQIGGPTGIRCETAVSAPSGGVASAGGSVNIAVGAARDCTWSAASEASWLSVNPSTGQGDGAVVVTVAPNPQPAARAGRVTVNGTRVTVTQSAAPAAPACRVELNRTAAHVGPEGGRTTVQVNTASGCAWQAVADAAWIQLRSNGGTGSGTLEIDVAPNSGGTRAGTVTVAGVSVNIAQDGQPNPPGAPGGTPGDGTPPSGNPPNGNPPSGNPPSGNPPNGNPPGGTPPGGNPPGGTPPGGGPGGGPSSPPPSAACTFNLAPPARSFPRDGGEHSFRVVTGDDCAWSVTSSASWVTVRSGASGRGSGEVRYTVAENRAAAPRTATISVAGRSHVVSQEAGRAQRVEIEGRVTALSGTCPTLTFTVGRWTVVTDSGTKYDDGRCRDVRNGVEVEVDGEVIGENRVRAREIELD